MTEEFVGSPQQFDIVTTLAEQIYNDFGIPSERVFRGPFCWYVSRRLVPRLIQAGFSARLMVYNKAGLHEHIRVSRWRIDPTWQLFLDPNMRLEILPKVLILREKTLSESLTAYGIKQTDLVLWTEAESANMSDLGNYWWHLQPD